MAEPTLHDVMMKAERKGWPEVRIPQWYVGAGFDNWHAWSSIPHSPGEIWNVHQALSAFVDSPTDQTPEETCVCHTPRSPLSQHVEDPNNQPDTPFRSALREERDALQTKLDALAASIGDVRTRLDILRQVDRELSHKAYALADALKAYELDPIRVP